eukprot:GDKK01015566.1.p1 GENE.GDKK01015566.1~~GDKK01015566.1.p1  ORF type:complete len:937 (+),score=220.89 GDKK01015566.1:204-2813(+)
MSYGEPIRSVTPRTVASESESPDAFLSMDDPLAAVPINHNEWMITVAAMLDLHLKSNLTLESLFCAVHMLCRLVRNPTSRVPLNNLSQLMMTGFVCLWSAAKIEETMWEPVCGKPHISQLVELGEGKYTKKDVIALECEILQALGWNISPPNMYTYLLMTVHAGYANEGDRKVRVMSRYLAELSLFDPRLVANVHPSRVAASCFYLSMRINNVKSNNKQARQQSLYPASNGCTDASVWTAPMSLFACGLQERALLPVVNIVRRIACDVLQYPTHPGRPVQVRYAQRHFEYVATQPPPSKNYSPFRTIHTSSTRLTSAAEASPNTHERLSPGEMVSPVVPPHTTRSIRNTPLSSGQSSFNQMQQQVQTTSDVRNAAFKKQLTTASSSSSRPSQKSSDSSIAEDEFKYAYMNNGDSYSSGSSELSAQELHNMKLDEAVALYTADYLKRNGLSQSLESSSTKASSNNGLHPDIARKLNPEVARRVLQSSDDLLSSFDAKSRDDDISALSEWMARLSTNDDLKNEMEEIDARLHKISKISAGDDGYDLDDPDLLSQCNLHDETGSRCSSGHHTQIFHGIDMEEFSDISDLPSAASTQNSFSLHHMPAKNAHGQMVSRMVNSTRINSQAPSNGASSSASRFGSAGSNGTTGSSSNRITSNSMGGSSSMISRQPSITHNIPSHQQNKHASTSSVAAVRSSTTSQPKSVNDVYVRRSSAYGVAPSTSSGTGKSPAAGNSNRSGRPVVSSSEQSANRSSSLMNRSAVPVRPSGVTGNTAAAAYYSRAPPQTNAMNGVIATRLARPTPGDGAVAASLNGNQLPPLDYQAAMAKAAAGKQQTASSTSNGSRLVPSGVSHNLIGSSSASSDYLNKRSAFF